MMPGEYDQILSSVDDARIALRQTFGWILAHLDTKGLPKPETLAEILRDLNQSAEILRRQGAPKPAALP